MNSYCISYDLCSPHRDYSSLYDAIRDYGTYAKITESFWIVRSSGTSTTIRDNLSTHIDSNDKLFIAKLSGESAWSNLNEGTTKWLKK